MHSSENWLLWLAEEQQRQWLLKHWALRFMDLTRQPLDVLSAYFGAKVS